MGNSYKIVAAILIGMGMHAVGTHAAITAAAGTQLPACGNKHANLVKLQTILRGTPQVEVPPFFGISSTRIEQFLMKHNPQIFEKYQIAISHLKRELSTQQPEQRNSQRTNPFQRLFQAIMTPIRLIMGQKKPQTAEDTLAAICRDILRTFYFSHFEFTPEELAFFKSIERQNGFLMVRSTGMEDSATTANAGGNASFAYIKPDVAHVTHYISQVVCSYFTIHSLKNCLAENEQLSTPFIPVLIQELVGENPLPKDDVHFFNTNRSE